MFFVCCVALILLDRPDMFVTAAAFVADAFFLTVKAVIAATAVVAAVVILKMILIKSVYIKSIYLKRTSIKTRISELSGSY